MDHKDTTGMGAMFDAWTSAAERGAADKMPAWGVEGETPEEGAWPARDRVPFVPEDAFNKLAARLIEDGVVGVKDGKLITAAEMYVSPIAGWEAPAPTAAQSAWIAANPIGLAPAEVTPEMALAGATRLIQDRNVGGEFVWVDGSRLPMPSPDEFTGWVAGIYRAMHAAAPVPLVSDAEIALTRERDQLQAAYDELGKTIGNLMSERDSWRRVSERLEGEKITLRAELMAARDQLAKFTVQNVAEPEAPDPIANALRPRETDRRRVGS